MHKQSIICSQTIVFILSITRKQMFLFIHNLFEMVYNPHPPQNSIISKIVDNFNAKIFAFHTL